MGRMSQLATSVRRPRPYLMCSEIRPISSLMKLTRITLLKLPVKRSKLSRWRSIARRTANDARCSSSAPWRPVVSCCSSSPSSSLPAPRASARRAPTEKRPRVRSPPMCWLRKSNVNWRTHQTSRKVNHSLDHHTHTNDTQQQHHQFDILSFRNKVTHIYLSCIKY